MKAALAIVGVLQVVLVQCSGEAKTVTKAIIDPDAVKVVASGMDVAPKKLSLGASGLDDIAADARVTPQAVEEVAPRAGSTSIWRRSADNALSAYNDLPDEAKEVVASVACDELTNPMSPEQLLDELSSELAAAGQPDSFSSMIAVFELHNDLAAAMRSENPDERVAAVLACYTMGQLASN